MNKKKPLLEQIANYYDDLVKDIISDNKSRLTLIRKELRKKDPNLDSVMNNLLNIENQKELVFFIQSRIIYPFQSLKQEMPKGEKRNGGY